jgi:hypothetical protein
MQLRVGMVVNFNSEGRRNYRVVKVNPNGATVEFLDNGECWDMSNWVFENHRKLATVTTCKQQTLRWIKNYLETSQPTVSSETTES